ncbi:MAG: flavodoxin family protein [Desulfobulbaceae bacterium]|jgi:multimeric flavodoxin WrbA|nr:flavodoxin family protein [Desulfobulbaceae bacterium]
MNMLVVLGSPRKNGNSETLAAAVASGFCNKSGMAGTVAETVRLNDLAIRPCQACGGCAKTGRCVVSDDMTALYEKVDAADRLLLVSPVYFYALSAQMKAFADRFQCRWSRRYLLRQRFRQGEDRLGCLLSTAATKGTRLFAASELSARYIFDAMDIPQGPSFLAPGLEGRSDAKTRPDLLNEALDFGRKLAEQSAE